MAENGIGWVKWILRIIIVVVLPFMVTAIWSNDKDSRARDIKIAENMETRQAQIYATMNNINISLVELRTDMKYVKKEVTR